MNNKILNCYLVPNRSDRKRGVRMIIYRRRGPHVQPIGIWPDCESAYVEYARIRGSDVDPEFAAAWREHLTGQERRDDLGPSVTRADLIARGLVRPCRPVHHTASECP